MAADGYILEVSLLDGEGLQVDIVAGTDACEECSIPTEMFSGMVSSRMSSPGVAS